MFNSFDYNFLEEIEAHELDDCYLRSKELNAFLAPSSKKWNDVSSCSFLTYLLLIPQK
jgi:hypothetical protein